MGCSESKTNLAAISPIEAEHRPKSPKPNLVFNQQFSNRIVEDCIVVWLLNDSSLNIDLEKTKLCRIVSTIKTFTDRDECVTYITNIRIEKIFFIIPTKESFVDSIQNLPQLEKVYVFNPSLHETEHTLSNVFYDIDNLCQQLETDVEL
jgi:hypothetical protein